MNLKDYIKTYNSIPPKTVSKLVRWANQQSFNDAITLGGLDKKIRNVMECPLYVDKNNKTKTKWFNLFTKCFYNIFEVYKKDTNNNLIGVRYVLNINLLKYEKDYFYINHVDHAPDIPRTISFIIFLNNDYEGGELIFNFTNGEKHIVKPEVGKVLVWPSTFMYPHQVNSVTKGTRYVVVGWVL